MEIDRAVQHQQQQPPPPQPPDGNGSRSPLSTSPASPASGRPRTKIIRNQNACDACRARKVRCLYGAGETRHAQQQHQLQAHQQQQQALPGPANQQSPSASDITSPDLNLAYQTSPASSSAHIHTTPRSHSHISASAVAAAASTITAAAATSSSASSVPDLRALIGAPSPTTGPGPGPGHGTTTSNYLALFAPEALVHRILHDWFEKVHSLAPVLHRRRFMHRLKAGEAASDRTFCALVVSVCAATVATLRRADYHPVTVEGCLDFIEDHHLLNHGIRKPAYSLDWCIAMYNIGTSASSMNENGLGDMGSFHGMSEAAAGARFLAYYRMADLDMSEQQLLKRLFWLIFAAYCSADIFGRLSVSIVSHQENRAHLRPLPLSDSQLDTGPQLSPADGLPPWHGDTTSYVPGLNHLSDLFLIWHEAQTAPVSVYGGQEDALKHYLARIQTIIDSFPPELRWRGGLSRPGHITEGHDTQIANLFITSLNIRSNLLQKFGSTVKTRAAEHQRIVDDLLEILYHMPQHVLEQNGNSLIPKLRDCGAAYMEQMNIGDGGDGGGGPETLVSESARLKLEKLLRKLDDIDCWPGLPGVESPQSNRQ
ncbi:hypothetical protein GCG54_00005040 [Colletotrichum gloeosporioides]|uniref:Zn(2)-C6 fungal-type domain-containing protein n=1 Tax=Colletotrichum gloeosporioides TaxID=474922 RepID=A0A8H4CKI6_COLGL|nr:uncharacterized protein GCG54_00005040 [Colletotrichum gloeosporioides]KAF3805678.1 hypothetical protein GCG54_00005040 [Colletotrichum gloeosporioides]